MPSHKSDHATYLLMLVVPQLYKFVLSPGQCLFQHEVTGCHHLTFHSSLILVFQCKGVEVRYELIPMDDIINVEMQAKCHDALGQYQSFCLKLNVVDTGYTTNKINCMKSSAHAARVERRTHLACQVACLLSDCILCRVLLSFFLHRCCLISALPTLNYFSVYIEVTFN